MKLGAQLFSLRTFCKTPEGIRDTFRRVKEIGYEVVQVSGCGPIEPERLRDISEEFSLPITCTHSPADRILNDTDKLIADHRIYGCNSIGIGSMDGKYRGSLEGVRAFISEYREACKKIHDAGMQLTYHNHDFEFVDFGGTDLYEVLIEESEFDFIHDVYWSTFAGKDPLAYVPRLAGRMTNIHFKDLSSAENHPMCACGDGVIDFKPLIAAAEKAGVKYVQVEQDNAPDFPDAFEQMQISFKTLRPLIK